MSNKFVLPYRKYVEENSSSLTYQALINAWQIATFDLENIVDNSKKRIGYYETFLYDILYQGYEAYSLSGGIESIYEGVHASVLKDTMGFLEEKLGEDIFKKSLNNISKEEQKEIVGIFQDSQELKAIFKQIDDLHHFTTL